MPGQASGIRGFGAHLHAKMPQEKRGYTHGGGHRNMKCVAITPKMSAQLLIGSVVMQAARDVGEWMRKGYDRVCLQNIGRTVATRTRVYGESMDEATIAEARRFLAPGGAARRLMDMVDLPYKVPAPVVEGVRRD